MSLENRTVLITGANRGIGRTLVEEALKRGAKRVYAGTRSPFQHSDKRVTPLTLDVTNAEQIQRAVSGLTITRCKSPEDAQDFTSVTVFYGATIFFLPACILVVPLVSHVC